ncbi:MAG TPA: DUF6259 domain-containing protein [Chitinophagaceae bacterium]|nr:DUF6259 domain-containing protein [Chitinophagaceae bacterium]
MASWTEPYKFTNIKIYSSKRCYISVVPLLVLLAGTAAANNPMACTNFKKSISMKRSVKKNIALVLPLFCAQLVFSQEIMEVSTDVCDLRLNKTNGNVVGLHWKNPDEEIIKETRLGENFRILLPLPNYEANYFISTDQQVRFEKISNGIICHYDKLVNARQTLNVKVDYKVESKNGQLLFSIIVNNPTDQPLAEVYYGIIGGQKGLRNRLDTRTLVPGGTTNNDGEMFTRFAGGGYGGGNLGITYSATGITYPSWSMSMSWMEIFNPKENIGMYYAQHDSVIRKAALYYELRPSEKGNVIGDNWPNEKDVPEGTPIGLTMGWVNMPYTKRGIFSSAPVVLQLHQGDWHQGSQIYRQWFDRYYKVARSPTWLRNEMAWQSIIMSNSEDAINYRFNDLPKLATDAKKYGVTTFEILGWDRGGIDRGYPEYEPDRRLGTKDDFKRALTAIKTAGVHPLIFANIQWVDTDIPLYYNKLKKYETKGRWADDLILSGYGEGTISSRLGITRHNMTQITPSYPEVNKLLMDYFLDLVASGADGFQFDKTTSIDFDFNPLLKLSPDRAMAQAVFDMLGQVLKEGRKIDPHLAIASELIWDRAFQYVDVSYLRMNDIDMDPALKYTFPEWTSTIFAESPFDFNIMNNGMRYGFVWALAPRHYSASLDEAVTQPLSRYVAELIRIRKKFAGILFTGRFMDTLGAVVSAGQNSRFSVFEPLHDTTRKAVVIVNFDNKEDNIEVNIPNVSGNKVELCIPFQQDTKLLLPSRIKVPARTCAVLVSEK